MADDAELERLRRRVRALELQHGSRTASRRVVGFYPAMAVLTAILSPTTLYEPEVDGTLTYTYGSPWHTPFVVFWLLLAGLLTFSWFRPEVRWVPLASAVVGSGLAIGVLGRVGATGRPELTDAGTATVGLGVCVAVVCVIHAVLVGTADDDTAGHPAAPPDDGGHGGYRG